MSNPDSTSLVEVRHLELGERVSDDQLTRSARQLINQASTNHSSDVWRGPCVRRSPIGRFSSICFAYFQSPPNKRTLVLTIPVAPPSNIPPLLDWGSSPTELEGLGLSGLEEFRSGIKPPTKRLPITLKRRRSIEERPQVSSLIKKPRFAVPRPSPANFASPAVSEKVQNAALSALQSKSSTKGNGSVRLRLGLSKRTNIGSKLESNRTPYDVSVKVKLTPRHPIGSDPPPFPVTELSDSSNSVDGTFALGFKIPDTVLATSRNEKLQIQLPMKSIPITPRPSSVSNLGASKTPGRILVQTSPSPLANRIMDITSTHPSDPKSASSCADTTMLSDGALVSPQNDTTSFNFLPPPRLPAASLLPTKDHRVQAQEGDMSNITSDVLLSASLSLSLEDSGQSNSLVRKDTTEHLSSHLDTSYDLKPNQLMASIIYDSSQDSNDSQADRPNHSPNSPVASSPANNYESLPWDLSQQDEQDGIQSHYDHDLRSPVSLAAKGIEINTARPDDSDINEHSSDSSDPRNRHPTSGLISVLYDSSQDSLRSQPQKGTPSDQRHQHDSHSIDGDASLPRPTWSPDTSLQSRSNFLSGAQPTSSWGSLPGSTRISPNDLVSASRSLSLEDFEVSRPSDHQLRNASPVRLISPAPLRLSATHHSNIPIESVDGSIYTPSPCGAHMPTDKRSGISELASHTGRQGSLLGSHSPILSFTPLSKPNIPDNSLESIESPDTSQRINAGNSFRPNPIFRFPLPNPIPDLEEDISCESQILRPQLKSASHGTQTISRLAQTPEVDPTPENHGARDDCASVVPNSDDGGPTEEPKIPASVGDKKNMENRTITQSDSRPPVADQLSSPIPQPRPPSPSTNQIYKGPLHTVIPQPHFLPSLPCPPPPLTEGMLSSLVPPSFQNWLNKDGTPAQDQAMAAANFQSDAWGRAAWIIPVRGRAPWDGCSAAIVSLRPIKERKKRIIVWTPASLRSFWTQMAGFRDTKRVGSLSMSFEAVPGKPPKLEVPKQPSALKASRSFEFIKLYHDARVSLKLRTILQVLEFADEDRYGIDAEVAKEGELGTVTTRRLLGASTRLALLDSTGHVVLIS